MASSSSNCHMTRAELQRLLADSGFGTNVPMFCAYFVPDSSPPRCVVCQRTIGEHPDAGPSQMLLPSSEAPQQQQPAMGIMIGADEGTGDRRGRLIASLLDQRQGTPADLPPPPTLTVDPSKRCDKNVTPLSKVNLMIAGILLLIGTVMFAAFAGSGLIMAVPYVAIAPSVLILFAFIGFISTSRTTTEFDHQKKEVRYRKRFLLGCSGASGTCRFDEIDQARDEMTGTRVNNQPLILCNMHISGRNEKVLLERYIGYSNKTPPWNSYFARLKEEARGGGGNRFDGVGATNDPSYFLGAAPPPHANQHAYGPLSGIQQGI